MPIFQNLKCWLADNEGNILLEQSVSDVNSVVTTSIMTQESQPFIVYWKNTAGASAPLSGRWELHFRPDLGKRKCIGGRWMDTQQGNSQGMLYHEQPLVTPKKAQRSCLLCTVMLKFNIDSDGQALKRQITFKFMMRKPANASQLCKDPLSISTHKRRQEETETTSERLRQRARRRVSPDVGYAGPSPTSLDDLVNDSHRLKDEHMVVEEEENQMCAMLEEKNARLRERIRERRKTIAAAKEIMSLL